MFSIALFLCDLLRSMPTSLWQSITPKKVTLPMVTWFTKCHLDILFGITKVFFLSWYINDYTLLEGNYRVSNYSYNLAQTSAYRRLWLYLSRIKKHHWLLCSEIRIWVWLHEYVVSPYFFTVYVRTFLAKMSQHISQSMN